MNLGIVFISVLVCFGHSNILLVRQASMIFCCSSKENLMREKSILKGTSLRYFTLSILFLCLLPAMFGIGDERIQTLTWNQGNADDNTVNDSQLVFNYELKTALPDYHHQDGFFVGMTII